MRWLVCLCESPSVKYPEVKGWQETSKYFTVAGELGVIFSFTDLPNFLPQANIRRCIDKIEKRGRESLGAGWGWGRAAAEEAGSRHPVPRTRTAAAPGRSWSGTSHPDTSAFRVRLPGDRPRQAGPGNTSLQKLLGGGAGQGGQALPLTPDPALGRSANPTKEPAGLAGAASQAGCHRQVPSQGTEAGGNAGWGWGQAWHWPKVPPTAAGTLPDPST